LLMGQNMIVCYIDFSKAFDMVNRNILFYKIIKQGFCGRLTDVIRDMYTKTKCKVKTQEGLSPYIQDIVGVNQGGVISPLLFRKYLSDIDSYLKKQCGIVINDEDTLVHLLWADDLVLMSNTPRGMNILLGSIEKFCADNLMIVNEAKTKIMTFGKPKHNVYHLNGKEIGVVDKYKYLGNVISSTKTSTGDIFRDNSTYLEAQAVKAMYAMLKKTSPFGRLSPKISLHLFDSLVQPILLYGSDVWGVREKCYGFIEKVHLQFLRMMLGVKMGTCKTMLYGDCGRMPVSKYATVNALKYWKRLCSLSDDLIVKQVYNSLLNLHNIGFHTWVTDINRLLNEYTLSHLWQEEIVNVNIKQHILQSYKDEWKDTMSSDTLYPIMRTYRMIKTVFGLEPYLQLREYNIRKALSKLRMSSHPLAIERGRYTRPKTPIEERLCVLCVKGAIENEEHFISVCSFYNNERNMLQRNISSLLGQDGVTYDFITLLKHTDPDILLYVGKFINVCMQKRDTYFST